MGGKPIYIYIHIYIYIYDNTFIYSYIHFILFECRYAKQRALQRADALKSNVRVVKQQPTPVLALLLQSLFSTQVSKSTVAAACSACPSSQGSIVHCLLDGTKAQMLQCCSPSLLLQPCQAALGSSLLRKEHVCSDAGESDYQLCIFWQNSCLL